MISARWSGPGSQPIRVAAAGASQASSPFAKTAASAPPGVTSARSPRSPGAMRPRSYSPSASAGLVETSAQACARFITPRAAIRKGAASSAGQ